MEREGSNPSPGTDRSSTDAIRSSRQSAGVRSVSSLFHPTHGLRSRWIAECRRRCLCGPVACIARAFCRHAAGSRISDVSRNERRSGAPFSAVNRTPSRVIIPRCVTHLADVRSLRPAARVSRPTRRSREKRSVPSQPSRTPRRHVDRTRCLRCHALRTQYEAPFISIFLDLASRGVEDPHTQQHAEPWLCRALVGAP